MSIMRNRSIALVISLSVISIASIEARADDAELPSVIESIERFEQLYSKIDLTFRSHMDHFDAKYTHKGFVSSKSDRTHVVFQNGRESYDYRQDSLDTSGETIAINDQYCWDGLQSIRVLNGYYSTINDEQNIIGYMDSYSPYRLIYDRCYLHIKLSEILKGTQSLKKYKEHAHLRSEIHVLNDETIDGLVCKRIRVDIGKDKYDRMIDIDHYHFWLAVDRNLIPIRWKYYDYTNPLDAPEFTGEADEFHEVEPGMWYPYHTRVKYYDLHYMREDRRVVLTNVEDSHVENVDFHPNYDEAFFHRVKIPDGTTVHVVRKGVIVESYVQGLVKPVKAVRRFSMMWILAGLIVSALIVLLLIRFYLRSNAYVRKPIPSKS